MHGQRSAINGIWALTDSLSGMNYSAKINDRMISEEITGDEIREQEVKTMTLEEVNTLLNKFNGRKDTTLPPVKYGNIELELYYEDDEPFVKSKLPETLSESEISIVGDYLTYSSIAIDNWKEMKEEERIHQEVEHQRNEEDRENGYTKDAEFMSMR